ncbi:MAG: hypothetical protein ACRDH2_09035 [Anaerolineales bacterium]
MGKLIYDGPLSTIKDRFGKYRTISFDTIGPVGGFDPATGSGLVLPPAAEVEAQEDRKLVLRFDRTRTTASRVAAAMMDQIEVVDFSLAEPDLSSVVRQIYSGALHGEAVPEAAP